MKDFADHTLTRANSARFLLSQIEGTAAKDRVAAVAACDAALDILAPQCPDLAPLNTDYRDEADWWATFATDTMRAAMLAACLRHIATVQINTRTARKQAIVAIWNSMDETDRTAFLELVDPGSKAEV